MASDAFLIAKLQMRRARSWTSRAFALTGSNPFRDKTFMDRAYQVYALLVVAVALALIWVMALAQIESVFSLMPPEAAELTLRAVLAAASLAFCVLGVRALDRGPFSFSNADIAYLVTSRVDLGLVLLSGFAASLARALIVGAFAGVAFGVAAGAAGSSVSLVVSAVVFASMFGSVAGAPWAIGAARVRRASPRRGSSSCASLLLDRGWRRWVAKGLVALIAISLTFLSMTSAPGFLSRSRCSSFFWGGGPTRRRSPRKRRSRTGRGTICLHLCLSPRHSERMLSRKKDAVRRSSEEGRFSLFLSRRGQLRFSLARRCLLRDRGKDGPCLLRLER